MGLSTGCLTTWELRANTQDQSHSLFISLSQAWHLLTLAIFCSLSVQLLSCVQLYVTPWTAARQASLSITNSQSLLKLMSINSVMPFNHLILCRPLLLLPSVFHSLSLSVSVYYKWVYSLHSKEGDFKRAWISECREYWEIITEATNDTAWPWLKQQTFFSSKFLR